MMSIVNVIGADCCGRFLNEKHTVGVSTQADLFDKLKSYPTIFLRQENAHAHYCLSCYREQVLIPAENQHPRNVDGKRHESAIAEFAYLFRKKVVDNWQTQKYFSLKKLQKPL